MKKIYFENVQMFYESGILNPELQDEKGEELTEKNQESIDPKYENIARLIFDNVKNNPSRDFAKNLVDMLINEEGLTDYIRINRIDLEYLYNIIDIVNVQKNTKPNKYVKVLKKESYSVEYYYYLMITRLILKEIRLLKMRKKNSENILKPSILKASLETSEQLTQKHNANAKEKQALYKSMAPEEIRAEEVSYDGIDEITKLLEEDNLNLINTIEAVGTKVNPYLTLDALREKRETKQKSPALFYLEEIGCKRRYLNEIKKYNCGLKTRLSYGLEVPENIIDGLNSYKRELELNLTSKNSPLR